MCLRCPGLTGSLAMPGSYTALNNEILVFCICHSAQHSDDQSTGNAGSNVSLTLYFLRFALIINILMTAIWVIFTVFPFLTSPPTSFSWQIFTDTSPSLMLQGYGLDDTFLLYGEFSTSIIRSMQDLS